jgi:hypothetical protein
MVLVVAKLGDDVPLGDLARLRASADKERRAGWDGAEPTRRRGEAGMR